ncbi:MAG: alpha-amylase family glycosyl hydrolase [Verrucomicrobiales bacterium]
MKAGEDFLDPAKSMDVPFMPNWKRVLTAFPDVLDEILLAVDDDMAEFGSESTTNPAAHPQAQRLRQRIDQHVQAIYSEEDSATITERIMETGQLSDYLPVPGEKKWDQSDVLMITYADSIYEEGRKPLATLRDFLNRELKNTLSGVHILPFNPWSSDDGFSVTDYHAVKPEYGSWEDIAAISGDYTVMGDLVINHCSSESAWFQNFLADKDPGRGYFIDGSEFTDLSQVVRPRPSPLMTSVETVKGQKEVWCTFSPDQVDLDFRNPEVLLEVIRVIRTYLKQGVTYFRLDAIAFLWKEDATPCVHLPQTHELIKLLRLVIESLEPNAVIITETNVPNRENLSYFGNENEAHLIYNFSLPPLLLHTLLSGNCTHLKTWMMSMPPARQGRSYLNFIASHDGIGLRPAEGLLSEEERDGLIQTLRDFGGEISMRKMPDGELAPYEANISLFSALQGTIAGGPDQWQIDRFLCAHTIMLALEGLPAIYLHSLLGTENDRQGFAESGQPRRINRKRWEAGELKAALAAPHAHHGRVFEEMKRLIKIRREQAAFHPNATQYTLHFGDEIFAFWRESPKRDQSIFALHNISGETQKIPLVELNLIATETWRDLLSGARYDDLSATLELPPYACVWITNRA